MQIISSEMRTSKRSDTEPGSKSEVFLLRSERDLSLQKWNLQEPRLDSLSKAVAGVAAL